MSVGKRPSVYSAIKSIIWFGSEWVREPGLSTCLYCLHCRSDSVCVEFNRKVCNSNRNFGRSGPINAGMSGALESFGGARNRCGVYGDTHCGW